MQFLLPLPIFLLDTSFLIFSICLSNTIYLFFILMSFSLPHFHLKAFYFVVNYTRLFGKSYLTTFMRLLKVFILYIYIYIYIYRIDIASNTFLFGKFTYTKVHNCKMRMNFSRFLYFTFIFTISELETYLCFY